MQKEQELSNTWEMFRQLFPSNKEQSPERYDEYQDYRNQGGQDVSLDDIIAFKAKYEGLKAPEFFNWLEVQRTEDPLFQGKVLALKIIYDLDLNNLHSLEKTPIDSEFPPYREQCPPGFKSWDRETFVTHASTILKKYPAFMKLLVEKALN